MSLESVDLAKMADIAFAVLLERARRKTVRIWAEQSPFELKDTLKRRGYRWSDGSDGRPRSWYVDVDEANQAAEIDFLQTEIYLREVNPRAEPGIPAISTADEPVFEQIVISDASLVSRTSPYLISRRFFSATSMDSESR